jgi:ABC-type multidrug transport system permease subunit
MCHAAGVQIIYVCITYWMMGFERNAAKFFWYGLWVLLTLLYYSFYGAQPPSLLL